MKTKKGGTTGPAFIHFVLLRSEKAEAYTEATLAANSTGRAMVFAPRCDVEHARIGADKSTAVHFVVPVSSSLFSSPRYARMAAITSAISASLTCAASMEHACK
jgi:hypothetical protein